MDKYEVHQRFNIISYAPNIINIIIYIIKETY